MLPCPSECPKLYSCLQVGLVSKRKIGMTCWGDQLRDVGEVGPGLGQCSDYWAGTSEWVLGWPSTDSISDGAEIGEM